MKKIVFRLLKFLALGIVFSVLATSILLWSVPDVYSNAYQRAIVSQYNYYKELKGNKIVFIGNSSLSFGLDLNLMEELTGRPCSILGNHAGMDQKYFLEMSKKNLNAGDVVVIEYAGRGTGTQLLLTGIGKNYEMYQFFNGEWGEVLKGLPEYLQKSLSYTISNSGYHASGSYSMDSYDNRGNMSVYRGECEIPFPYTDEVAKTYSWKTYTTEFDPESIDILNQYIDYCESMGVHVYITQQNYLDEAVKSSEEEIVKSDQTLSQLLHAPLISDSRDYIFSREYTYNAIAHCNTLGAQKRTRLLFHDLSQYEDVSP